MSKEKVQKQRNTDIIDVWIEKLELSATALLVNLDLSELSARERYDLALKTLALMQRFIALRQQIDGDTPDGQSNAILAALMRQMRGEMPLETGDAERWHETNTEIEE